MIALAGASSNLANPANFRVSRRFWIYLVALALAIYVGIQEHVLQQPSNLLSGWFDNIATTISPVEALRFSFSELDFGIDSNAKALVGGLAFGADAQLDQVAKEAMRISGLSHLTAVSGTNCAIVAGAVWLVARKVFSSIRVQLFFVSVALVSYLFLVGFEPSVVRATAMALAVVLVKMLGRPNSTLPALTLAVSVLLLLNPSFASDYGFTLSVLATFGILVIAPAIHRRLSNRFPAWLSILVSASFSAQILTLPVIYELQGSIPVFSLIANLLVEPLVAFVTILGLMTLITAFFIPAVAAFFGWVASVPAYLILTVANSLASAPGAELNWQGPFAMMALVALAIAFFVFARSKSKKSKPIFLIAFALIALTIGSSIALGPKPWHLFPNDWQIVQCDVGQGDALLVRSQSQVLLIDTGNNWSKLELCLRQSKVDQIDHLVLTHFDLDHIGAAENLISGNKVQEIFVSAWPDERWVANNLMKQAERKRIPVVKVSAGFQFESKKLRVEVLSPPGLSGADSNDSSLVLLVTMPTLVLLALADTGEQAQMRLAQDFNFKDRQLPMVVKVAHHGSADQFFELYEELQPEVSLISVGANNSYGHPTERTLQHLRRSAKKILRTDEQGNVAIWVKQSKLHVFATG